jgi:hypothetical protein
MKKYCFDTSGISTPLERLPEDIYESLWLRVVGVIEWGAIAVTTEIYDELHGNVRGQIGECIDGNRARMVLEVGDVTWDKAAYRAANIRSGCGTRGCGQWVMKRPPIEGGPSHVSPQLGNV